MFNFLARQGLPFTVHGDDKDSNFKQLLRVRGEDDLTFTKWFKKNQTYTSPEVQNEMLKDMNFCMNLGDVVVEGIKNSDYHNKLVHESSDVSNKEQAMFCVCWVDVDLISYMEVWQRRRYISLFFLVFLFIWANFSFYILIISW